MILIIIIDSEYLTNVTIRYNIQGRYTLSPFFNNNIFIKISGKKVGENTDEWR